MRYTFLVRAPRTVYVRPRVSMPRGRGADLGENLSLFKNVTAGPDETHADVNKASCGANEVRDNWI